MALSDDAFDNAQSATAVRERTASWTEDGVVVSGAYLDGLHARLADLEAQLQARDATIYRLRSLSTEDETTGLLNRRGFLQQLRRELAFVERNPDQAGIVILFSIDSLFRIGETYGQDAAGAYARDFGHHLLLQVRTQDLVARLNDAEFMVLLTSIHETVGDVRAHQLARAVNTAPLMHNGRLLTADLRFAATPYRPGDSADDVLRRVRQKVTAPTMPTNTGSLQTDSLPAPGEDPLLVSETERRFLFKPNGR